MSKLKRTLKEIGNHSEDSKFSAEIEKAVIVTCHLKTYVGLYLFRKGRR